MEVDSIKTALAANSTQGLDQQSLGLNKKPVHILDLSQEHTNGRMFEQAVQNANKAGETGSATSDNVKLSNSKVDGNADAKNENPLTLNLKDPRQVRKSAENDEAEEEMSGEEVLKQALKICEIDYQHLTKISKDTIFVKGQSIDKFLGEDETSAEISSKIHQEDIKIGASVNISEHQQKRQKVRLIAQETYHEISHIEADVGHAFHASVIQGLDEADFGTEVLQLVFDRPSFIKIT